MKSKLVFALLALWFLGLSCDVKSKASFFSPQLDGKALDIAVEKAARAKSQDPKHYLLPIRINADGSRVFRQLGMHVIIAPNGEKRFLPDEI